MAGQFLLLGAVGVAGLVGPAWPSPLRPVRHAAALGAAAGATCLAGPAFRHLGDALTPFPRPRDGAALVEHGVYRLVRHPMYGALLCGSLAVTLASSPLAALPTALLAAELEAKRRVEERWLLGHYPGYADYRRRTRWRMVPYAW